MPLVEDPIEVQAHTAIETLNVLVSTFSWESFHLSFSFCVYIYIPIGLGELDSLRNGSNQASEVEDNFETWRKAGFKPQGRTFERALTALFSCRPRSFLMMKIYLGEASCMCVSTASKKTTSPAH